MSNNRFCHPGLLWAPWRRRPILKVFLMAVLGFLLVAGLTVGVTLMRRGNDREAVRDPRLFRHHTDHRLLKAQSLDADQAVFCSRAGVHWYDRRSQHLRRYAVADGVPKNVFFDGTNLLATLYDGSIADIAAGRLIFQAEPTIPPTNRVWTALDDDGERIFQIGNPSDPSNPSDPRPLVIDQATGDARAVCLYPDKLPREKLESALRTWARDPAYRQWVYPNEKATEGRIPISLRGKKDISSARMEGMLRVERREKPWATCIERLAARALPALCEQPPVRDAWFAGGHLFVATELGIVCLKEDGCPAEWSMRRRWTLVTQPCPSFTNDTRRGITQVRVVKQENGNLRGVALGADGRLYLNTGNTRWIPQHHARTFEKFSDSELTACFGNSQRSRVIAVTSQHVARYDLVDRRWHPISIQKKEGFLNAYEVGNRIWLARTKLDRGGPKGDYQESTYELQPLDWNGKLSDPVKLSKEWRNIVFVAEQPRGLTHDGVLCRPDAPILFEGRLLDGLRPPFLFAQVDDGLVAVDQSGAVIRYETTSRSWDQVRISSGYSDVRVIRLIGNELVLLGSRQGEHSRVEVFDLATRNTTTVWAGNAPPFAPIKLADIQRRGADYGVLTTKGVCWYYSASHGHWQELAGNIAEFALSPTSNRVALRTTDNHGFVLEISGWNRRAIKARCPNIAAIAGCSGGVFAFRTTDQAAWLVGATEQRLLGGPVEELRDGSPNVGQRLVGWPREAYRLDFGGGRLAYYDRELRILTPVAGNVIGHGARFMQLVTNRNEMTAQIRKWTIEPRVLSNDGPLPLVSEYMRPLANSKKVGPANGTLFPLQSSGDRLLGAVLRSATSAGGIRLNAVIEKLEGRLYTWQLETPPTNILERVELTLLRFPNLPRPITQSRAPSYADAVLTWSNGSMLVNTRTGQTFPWSGKASETIPRSEMLDGRSLRGMDGYHYFVDRKSGLFARTKDLGGWLAPLHRFREAIYGPLSRLSSCPLEELRQLWLAMTTGEQFYLDDQGVFSFGGRRLQIAGDDLGLPIPFIPTLDEFPARVTNQAVEIPDTEQGAFTECLVTNIVPTTDGFRLDTRAGSLRLRCQNGAIQWPLRSASGEDASKPTLATTLPAAWSNDFPRLPNAVHSVRWKGDQLELLDGLAEAQDDYLPTRISWREAYGTGKFRLHIATTNVVSDDGLYREQTVFTSDYEGSLLDGPFRNRRFVFDYYHTLHSISLPIDGKSGQHAVLAVSDHWMELFDANGRSLALDYSANSLVFGKGRDNNGVERIVRRQEGGTVRPGQPIEELTGVENGIMGWKSLDIDWDVACGRMIPELRWNQGKERMPHPLVATRHVTQRDDTNQIVADAGIDPVLSQGKWYFDDIDHVMGFNGEWLVTSGLEVKDARTFDLTWKVPNSNDKAILYPVYDWPKWTGFDFCRQPTPSSTAFYNPEPVRFDSILAVRDDGVHARAKATEGAAGKVYRVTRQGQLSIVEDQGEWESRSDNRLQPVVEGNLVNGWNIDNIRSSLTRPTATQKDVP